MAYANPNKFKGLINRRFFQNLLPIPAENELELGSIAPEIQIHDIRNDRQVKLSEYRGIKPVILDFTRIFTEQQYCPFCYPHIKAMNERYGEFVDRGIEVLMISSTDAQQSKHVVRDLDLQMPFLSDPSCSRFRRYHVGQALGAPLPAQFIIDKEGKIVFKHLFSFLHHNAEIDTLLASTNQAFDRNSGGIQLN
jgi:peroxiredoxin